MPKGRRRSNARPSTRTVRKAAKLLRSKRTSPAVKSAAAYVLRDAKARRGR